MTPLPEALKLGAVKPETTPPVFPGKEIEVHGLERLPPNRIRHALFDFDGTLSLLRGGWQQVMIHQFVTVLVSARTAETPQQLEGICREFISGLTGKQTIFQMLRLEDEMRKRGADCSPAARYKRQYLAMLNQRIAGRLESVRSGRQPPETYMVRGTERLLERLQRAGVVCHLASGTDHEYVAEEAELLGLTPCFGSRIYGAREDYRSFSKKIVIEEILRSHRLDGSQLVAFGDGYVELENVRAVGGVAVGVASLENGEQGWDLWKKERLRGVGAQILVPDWSDADLILDYLGVAKAEVGHHQQDSGAEIR